MEAQTVDSNKFLLVFLTIFALFLTSCSDIERESERFYSENKDIFTTLSSEIFNKDIYIDLKKDRDFPIQKLFVNPSMNYTSFFQKIAKQFSKTVLITYCVEDKNPTNCGLIIILERNIEEPIFYGYFVFDGKISDTNGDFTKNDGTLYLVNGDSQNLVSYLGKNTYYFFGRAEGGIR